MSRVSDELTPQQHKFFLEYVGCRADGLEKGRAIVKAYKEIYKPRHNDKKKIENAAHQIHFKISHKSSVQELVTDYAPKEEFARKLTSMMEAEKDNVHQGEVVSKSPDNVAQMKALDIYADIVGAKQKQRNIEINMTDKRQTLILEVPSKEVLNKPDKPSEIIEAEFIAEYEKEQED